LRTDWQPLSESAAAPSSMHPAFRNVAATNSVTHLHSQVDGRAPMPENRSRLDLGTRRDCRDSSSPPGQPPQPAKTPWVETMCAPAARSAHCRYGVLGLPAAVATTAAACSPPAGRSCVSGTGPSVTVARADPPGGGHPRQLGTGRAVWPAAGGSLTGPADAALGEPASTGGAGRF
jgi:hypothetical protein